MHFAFKTYHQYAKNKKTTPTHTTYIVELMKLLKGEPAMTTQQEEEAIDALFGEAEIYDTRVNILLDTGAVGCIISKQFLDKIGKSIEAATNVKIIDVNGNRSSPLGIMRQVPIKIRGLETKADMVVTDSKEYNVLLGNTWLKHVKAVINYDSDQCLIEVDDEEKSIQINLFKLTFRKNLNWKVMMKMIHLHAIVQPKLIKTYLVWKTEIILKD